MKIVFLACLVAVIAAAPRPQHQHENGATTTPNFNNYQASAFQGTQATHSLSGQSQNFQSHQGSQHFNPVTQPLHTQQQPSHSINQQRKTSQQSTSGVFQSQPVSQSQVIHPLPHQVPSQFQSSTNQFQTSPLVQTQQPINPLIVNPFQNSQSRLIKPSNVQERSALGFNTSPLTEQRKPIAIIAEERRDFDGQKFGNSYASEDGTKVHREGTVDQNGAVRIQGEYEYIDVDGNTVVVSYVADENGFQAQGNHIPQTPQYALDLMAMAEAQGKLNNGIVNLQ